MVAVTLDKLVVSYVKKGDPEKARAALARSVAIRAHFLAVGLSLQGARCHFGKAVASGRGAV
jgi:hypothetical protein